MRRIRSCVDDGASPTSAAISLTDSRAFFCNSPKMAISVRSRAELWPFLPKIFVRLLTIPTIILVLPEYARRGWMDDFDPLLAGSVLSTPEIRREGSHDYAAAGSGGSGSSCPGQAGADGN